MKHFQRAAVFLFILIVSGCATLNEEECLTANWQIIGLEDGSEGHLETYLGKHREACAKYGVTPDLEQYRIGHAEGVQSFCTPG